MIKFDFEKMDVHSFWVWHTLSIGFSVVRLARKTVDRHIAIYTKQKSYQLTIIKGS